MVKPNLEVFFFKIIEMSNKEDLNSSIKCEYCGWILDELINVNLMQHHCLKHFDEDKHVLYVDKNNVASIIDKNQSADKQSIQTSHSDYNEALVNVVYSRNALYDHHRISIKERTSLKKKHYGKKL
ncbi:hypothetical protein P5V15_006933 [Pogonomyrmex californicus]